MAQTDRDEVAELARALWSYLDWQRECGVTGLERSQSTPMHAASDTAVSASMPAKPAQRPAQAPAAERPREIEPEPTVGGAPKFEMPSFLKKKGPAPAAQPTLAQSTTPAPAPKPPPPAITPAPAAVQSPEPARARPPVTEDAPRRTTLFAEPKSPEIEQPRVAVPADFALVKSIDEMPRLEGESRIQRLRVLQEVVRECTSCRLHEGRTKSVFARGNPNASLAFVGEGPGRDEDLQGAPFVGAAGQLLDKIIAAMGLTTNDVYICNVVKCRPPNNRVPAPDEMASCGPYLVNQLGMVRPQWIVALGKTAASYLLNSTESMTRLRGTWHTWQGIPLLATWHPAYLLRTPAAKKDTWEDMKLVLQKMGRSVPKGGGARSE